MPYHLFLIDFGTFGHQIVSDGRCDENRGNGTDDDADNQREDERTDRLATEEENGQQSDERRTRRIDRTRQGRVDCVIDILLEIPFRIEAQVLADTVENHHGIVDRITDNRQNGRDEGLVYLQIERHDLIEQREDADDEERIDGQCHRGARSPLPTLEPERDIETDGDQREQHRIDGVPRHVAGDRRTDLVGRDDTVLIVLRVAEVLKRDIVRIERFQGIVDDLLDLGGRRVGRIIVLVLRYDAHLTLVAVLLHLVTGLRSIGIQTGERTVQVGTHVLGQNRLIEPDDVSTTTSELGARLSP